MQIPREMEFFTDNTILPTLTTLALYTSYSDSSKFLAAKQISAVGFHLTIIDLF